MSGEVSNFKKSSLSTEPKTAADRSAPEYGVPRKSLLGSIGPSPGLGSPQPNSSTSGFDGLLLNSLKDEGKPRKARKVEVGESEKDKKKRLSGGTL
jgi:hypothetical protein